jgi:hypothetical protein
MADEIDEKGEKWKPHRGQSIDALYAWVTTEPDGGEGICGATINFMGRETMMPLVGADMDRIKALRDYAEITRTLTGYPVRLVRFSRRDDLEVLP